MRAGLARPSLLSAAALLLGLLLGACGEPSSDGKLRVAVSVVPHAWLVDEVGGEHVEVVPLVLPGESPHSYQPSDAQVSAAMRSRIYFRTGVPFENGPWLGALADVSSVRIVDLRDGLPLRAMEAHGHEEDGAHDGHGHGEGHDPDPRAGTDPHVWLSPVLLARQAVTVAAALGAADPAHEEDYERNLARLLASLDATDAALRGILAPFSGRRVYVFHPAWGYLCDAYGLVQVPVETEGKEPSEAELTELVRQAKADGARVVFVQAQVGGRAAQALARALGAEVRYLDPLARDVPANLLTIAREIAAALE